MPPVCRLHVSLVTAILGWLPAFTLAQEAVENYPSKPVRVVVPSAPGGAIDIQARLFSQKLSEKLGKTFLVENRPGAGNTIGIGYVAKSAPDGYTLLALAPGFTFSPALYKNLPYDPQRDFSPISLVARSPYLLVVHPSLPVKSVRELIALAKTRPGQINAGVPGGAFSHLATAWLTQLAKVEIQIVPFKGGGPSVLATVTGEVQMAFVNVLSALPQVKLGKLKLLGASTNVPTPALPGVPTIAEAIPGFELYSWHGWVTPVGTPPAIVNKLSNELATIVRTPAVMNTLSNDGGEPIGSTPQEFGELISAEIVRWRKVVANSKMTVR